MRDKFQLFVWLSLWAACAAMLAHFLTAGTLRDWPAVAAVLLVSATAARETHRGMVG